MSVKGFKAFDTNFCCHNPFGGWYKRYKPNSSTQETLNPKLCERGMHFCSNILDVFRYYPTSARVARVEAVGKISRHNFKLSRHTTPSDTKMCTNKLVIGEELTAVEISDSCSIAWRKSSRRRRNLFWRKIPAFAERLDKITGMDTKPKPSKIKTAIRNWLNDF